MGKVLTSDMGDNIVLPPEIPPPLSLSATVDAIVHLSTPATIKATIANGGDQYKAPPMAQVFLHSLVLILWFCTRDKALSLVGVGVYLIYGFQLMSLYSHWLCYLVRTGMFRCCYMSLCVVYV